MITYRVRLAEKIGKINGRVCSVGNLYGVMRIVDGCANTWVMRPQNDEVFAHRESARLAYEEAALAYDRVTAALRNGPATQEQGEAEALNAELERASDLLAEAIRDRAQQDAYRAMKEVLP